MRKVGDYESFTDEELILFDVDKDTKFSEVSVAIASLGKYGASRIGRKNALLAAHLAQRLSNAAGEQTEEGKKPESIQAEVSGQEAEMLASALDIFIEDTDADVAYNAGMRANTYVVSRIIEREMAENMLSEVADIFAINLDQLPTQDPIGFSAHRN